MCRLLWSVRERCYGVCQEIQQKSYLEGNKRFMCYESGASRWEYLVGALAHLRLSADALAFTRQARRLRSQYASARR